MEFTQDKIQEFLNKYGATDEDLVIGWNHNPEDDNSEFYVNMGYRWIAEPYNVWVHRDDPKNKEEEEILEHLENNFSI